MQRGLFQPRRPEYGILRPLRHILILVPPNRKGLASDGTVPHTMPAPLPLYPTTGVSQDLLQLTVFHPAPPF